MIIKTIVCDMDYSRLYISDKLWYSPKHAVKEGRLKYLGMPGWYPTKNHKDVYDGLEKAFHITDLYPGEYIEVEYEMSNRLWESL